MTNCWATELWESVQLTESSAKPLLAKTRCTATVELLTKKEKSVRFCIMKSTAHWFIIHVWSYSSAFQLLEEWITCLLEKQRKIGWNNAKSMEGQKKSLI